MGKDKASDSVERKRKMGSTITIPERRVRGPEECVIGLQVITSEGSGEIFHFADLSEDAAPVQWFIIGRDPDNHIVLADKTVSKTHCFIQWDGRKTLLRDHDSKNHTLVNNVPLADGNTEILPGFIIELGNVELMACGGEPVTRPFIVTRDKYTFASKIDRYYPSPRKAHEGTGVARNTLIRWVEAGDIKVLAK